MATPGLLQGKRTNSGASSVTTLSLTYTSAISSGSTLLCFVNVRNQGATISVADDLNAGNYVIDVSPLGTTPVAVALARQSTVTSSVGLTPTVTVTSSASAVIWMIIEEWSNLASSPFDQSSAHNTNTTYTLPTTSGATGGLAASGELVVGFFGTITNWTGTITAGSGYTLDPNIGTGTAGAMTEYLISADTSAQTATFGGITNTPGYGSLVATYKPTGLAAPAVTPRGLLLGVGT